MRIDIDAARAARLENGDEPHELVVCGSTYEVPVEAPWEFSYLLARGQSVRAIVSIIGQEAWDEIASKASRNDVKELFDSLCDVWGLGSQGEQQASGGTSSDGGPSSRPTSSGSTGSTSETSGEDG